jgi:hypothetical protein
MISGWLTAGPKVRVQNLSPLNARAKEQAEKDAARREAVVPGLSPEQIAKAEELADWEFVKEGPNPQELRDHLASFPDGVIERMARSELEIIVWTGLDEVGAASILEDDSMPRKKTIKSHEAEIAGDAVAPGEERSLP